MLNQVLQYYFNNPGVLRSLIAYRLIPPHSVVNGLYDLHRVSHELFDIREQPVDCLDLSCTDPGIFFDLSNASNQT